MLFYLSNILPSFHRDINKIIAKKSDIFVIIYLNNILILLKTLAKAILKLFNKFL